METQIEKDSAALRHLPFVGIEKGPGVAQIADGVREGVDQMTENTQKEFDLQILRQEIIQVIDEVVGDPDEYSLAKVADDLIAKVRAYLIVENAELPGDPYKAIDGYRSDCAYDDGETDIVAEAAHHTSYSEAQQDMLAAGWRKVREEK